MFIEALQAFLQATYTALGDVPDRIEISPQMMHDIITEGTMDRRFTSPTVNQGHETFDYRFRNRTVQFRISENYRPTSGFAIAQQAEMQARGRSFTYESALRRMAAERVSTLYGDGSSLPSAGQVLGTLGEWIEREEAQTVTEELIENRPSFRDTEI